MARSVFLYAGPLLVLFLAIFFPRALAGFPALACLVFAGLIVLKKISLPRFDVPLALVLGALLGVMAASVLWSVNPEKTLDQTLSAAFIMLTGYGMIIFCAQKFKWNAQSLNRLPLYFIGAMVLAGVFFSIEFLTHMPLSHALIDPDMPRYAYNRSMVVYVLCVFPALFMLRHVLISSRAKMGLRFGLVGAVLIAVFSSQSQTAQVMFVVGLGVYGLLTLIQNQKIRQTLILFGGVLCSLVILSMPFVISSMKTNIVSVSSETSPSFVSSANMGERLEIWQFASQKILEKPLLGYGVEAMRILKADVPFSVNKTYTILHPHNGFLQLWVEMGVLGALVGIAILWLVIIRCLKDPNLQPVSIACLAATLCLIGTGYGLWQGWLIGFFMTFAALLTMLRGIPKPE
jgi:exopolysaccharide production protein ExoQ